MRRYSTAEEEVSLSATCCTWLPRQAYSATVTFRVTLVNMTDFIGGRKVTHSLKPSELKTAVGKDDTHFSLKI
jgi:nitrate/nitrite transporter NarK